APSPPLAFRQRGPDFLARSVDATPEAQLVASISSPLDVSQLLHDVSSGFRRYGRARPVACSTAFDSAQTIPLPTRSHARPTRRCDAGGPLRSARADCSAAPEGGARSPAG